MTDCYLSDITKHQMMIQDFEWIEGKYSCIYGCWCFGYLNEDDREKTITGMDSALTENGFLIFFEIVTKENEEIESRRHWWTE